MPDNALRNLIIALRHRPEDIKFYPLDERSTMESLSRMFQELEDGYTDNTGSRPDIIYPNKQIFLEEFSLNLQSGFKADGKITTKLIRNKEQRGQLPLVHSAQLDVSVDDSIIDELSDQFLRILNQHSLKDYKQQFPGFTSVLLVSDFTPAYHHPPKQDGLSHVFMPDMYFHQAVKKAGWDYLFWHYCDFPKEFVHPARRDSLHMYERSFFGLNHSN
ncbi:MAG: hypothetical protein SOI66_09035 [Bifidobacterium sp.]|jgi:hypothetical protein